MKEPIIKVGILSGQEIEFLFPAPFVASDATIAIGAQKASFHRGRILWQGRTYDELSFVPAPDADTYFELEAVTIGIQFHWERKEAQRFRGTLTLIAEEGRLTAVNSLPVEEYLTCVVSSEMNAQAPLEFLKAHAVIARGWAAHKLGMKNEESRMGRAGLGTGQAGTGHERFDVCADDHCQRYQGVSRATSPRAAEAVAATRGEVLTYGGELCDTRYSKCCGGAMERFSSCWEDVDYPYLAPRRDSDGHEPPPNLSGEEEAERWIRSTPRAFCHTRDTNLLGRALNNYDQETPDFYRWRVSYSQRELAELIAGRLGEDFGEILDLVPLKRGSSGRIVRLQIVGTRRTRVVGKELAIRRALSPSHLYSSAFVVDKEGTPGVPSRFVLTGAGWGHGVGLCQIGAAVMGERGYDYRAILAHYYPGSELAKHYP
ncbi:MAG: SpoIID/LytB domain-containing protein [Mediterranea sp.]|jgi:SpoIID/LytB domain protein|nr:SpoIID/LytB domain-containing protein [Mediterranea sp.]